MTADCAVALWNLATPIVCVSIYCPTDSRSALNNSLAQLHKITSYCDTSGYALLINGDFNAETPLWGRDREYIHSSSYLRGSAFADLFGAANLSTLNEAHTLTFKTQSALYDMYRC